MTATTVTANTTDRAYQAGLAEGLRIAKAFQQQAHRWQQRASEHALTVRQLERTKRPTCQVEYLDDHGHWAERTIEGLTLADCLAHIETAVRLGADRARYRVVAAG